MKLLPTRRFLALLAGAAILFLLDPFIALTADALLIGVLLLDAALTPRDSQIILDRAVPDRMPLGETGRVELTIWNRSNRPIHLLLTDDVLPPLARAGDDVLEADVPPLGEVRREYDVRATRRGESVIGDTHLRLLGPLGLAWTARRQRWQHTVLVQPGLAEVRRLRLLGLRHRLRDAGVRNIRFRGEAGAFESLREYVPGDDPRTVDWKATARTTQLMVRQYEAERSQSVVVAIDAGRLMAERLGERDRLDYALSAALLLADVADNSGDRVGVLVFSDRIHHYLPPTRVSLARLAETLARVEPRLVESNYPAAFTHLGRELRRRSLLVVLTDVIDTGASSALVHHLARSAHRHLPLVVALRNPLLEATSSREVVDETDAYRRAAAEELLQARAAALATMNRAGVLVADARPEDAAPAVVNRYLEVKARSLL